MKNSVKAMDKTKAAFKYLPQKFSRLSEAKINEGVFVGPQIRELLQYDQFHLVLCGKERTAWEAFKAAEKPIFLATTKQKTTWSSWKIYSEHTRGLAATWH